MSAVAPLPRPPHLGDPLRLEGSSVVYEVVASASVGDEVHVLAKNASGGMLACVWSYETRAYLGTTQRWPAATAHAAWSAHSRDATDARKRLYGRPRRRAREVITEPVLFNKRRAFPRDEEA